MPSKSVVALVDFGEPLVDWLKGRQVIQHDLKVEIERLVEQAERSR